MKKLAIIIFLAAMNGGLLMGMGESETSNNKLYVNEKYGFSFTYPEDFKESPVLYPREIIRLAVQNEFKVPVLTVSVNEKSENTDLSGIPQKVIAFMRSAMPDTSNYNILNEELITLTDGSQAVWLEFSWVLGDGQTVMETASVITMNKEYQVTITGNTIKGIGFPLSELSKICKTLELES